MHRRTVGITLKMKTSIILRNKKAKDRKIIKNCVYLERIYFLMNAEKGAGLNLIQGLIV